MAKVTVEGAGQFDVPADKVQALLGWLSSNSGARIQENNTVKEVKDNKFTGRDLLNG